MRSKIFITALAIVALMVVSASAQVPAKPFKIYLGGGLTMPSGNFGDAYKMGFHGNGKIGFVVSPKLDVMGSVAFHSFSIDDQGVSGIDGGTMTIIMIGGDARLTFPMPNSPVKPYALGGGGFGIAKVGEITVSGSGTTPSDSESKPYLEFGGGVEINKFFAEIKYVVLMTSGESLKYLPITVGVSF